MKSNTPGPARARYAARRRAKLLRNIARQAEAPATGQVDPTLVAQLEERIVAATHENTQLRDAVARQRAEFDNFRRRTQKEKDQIREAAKEDLIVKLLPVLDNFERALASTESAADAKSIREGITMVSSQLTRLLEADGLQRIGALNQPFDPNQHEALAAEERSDVPENSIIEELLPGYRYKDKVVRAAMVKVAKAAES